MEDLFRLTNNVLSGDCVGTVDGMVNKRDRITAVTDFKFK